MNKEMVSRSDVQGSESGSLSVGTLESAGWHKRSWSIDLGNLDDG